MKTKPADNIKLGIFVMAGLLLLILALYMIGRNSNLFGRNFLLRARVENAQGLTAGNNIRYSGIQVGTVKKISIINDTVIEITMLIDEKMKAYIHKNDIISIGTEGLVGNKLVNITPAKDNSPLISDGDILPAKHVAGTDEMLATLDKTNQNLVIISEDIKQTVQRINNSRAIWKILDEPTLPENLKTSMSNIKNASARADELVEDLHTIIADIKNGKGSLGAILTDTAIAYNLNQAITKIEMVGDNANQLADDLTALSQNIKQDINGGKGIINTLLKDTSVVIKLNNSLHSIEQGTEAFNQNMEALKHNFLLRGYFRKQEKQKKKQGSVTGN